MGYKKDDAIGTLLKVIMTKLNIAIRAFITSRKTSGKEKEWAVNTLKACLETIMRAIKSIMNKL